VAEGWVSGAGDLQVATHGYTRISILACLAALPPLTLLVTAFALLNAAPAAAISLPGSSRQCPELSRGSTGPCVIALQRRLDQEHVGLHIKINGIFGPLTLKAVEDFQHVKGLRVDGIVGRQTARKLDDSITATKRKASGKGMGTVREAFGHAISQHIPLVALLIGGLGLLGALIIVLRFARRTFEHRDVRRMNVRIRGLGASGNGEISIGERAA
jgi:hypothetical protein